MDYQYSIALQNLMKVYEQQVIHCSDEMSFLEIKKALRDYLKDEAIKTFEGVLNLSKEEFNTLKWPF